MINILENIEKVIVTEIAPGLEKKSLHPDEDLLENGIIDSLGLMKLIDFMEKSFGVKILDEQIVPENFQSLNNMVKLVELQLQGI
jgi:acyl carrier protein